MRVACQQPIMLASDGAVVTGCSGPEAVAGRSGRTRGRALRAGCLISTAQATGPWDWQPRLRATTSSAVRSGIAAGESEAFAYAGAGIALGWMVACLFFMAYRARDGTWP